MTIATEFHDWSAQPSADAHRLNDGSPALKRIRDHHLARWGGQSLSVPSLFQPRPIKGGTRPSAHAGYAVDIRWQDPGPGRHVVEAEIPRSTSTTATSCTSKRSTTTWDAGAWRAHRSHDANGGWKRQRPGSHDSNIGNPTSQWLHIEINRTGWHDDRPVEAMLNIGNSAAPVAVSEVSLDGFPPTDLHNGLFGLFPLNTAKAHIKRRDIGDLVLYAEAVIFHKAGGAIDMDSDFGEQTANRVSDVQRFFALPIHGEVDPATWGVIDLLATQPLDTQPRPDVAA